MDRYMNVEEFVDGGFLQEVNRQFFHPLGLALSVGLERGKYVFKGIWDSREDPEGMVFATLDDEEHRKKRDSVAGLGMDKARIRLKSFGWIVQPVPEHEDKNLRLV